MKNSLIERNAMTTTCQRPTKSVIAMMISAALVAAPSLAQADERNDLEQLRATTVSLIDALVEGGVMTREKANKLVADAEAKAKAQALARPRVAETPAPEIGPDGKKIVRVPYVPESMKREIREQVKTEVLAQAKTERWGEPGAMPDWLDRFSFEGDMRLRYEAQRFGQDNSPPGVPDFGDNSFTRAADISSNTSNGYYNFNTQDYRSRWRVRARLGVNAKVSDMTSAGIRISTGNSNDRESTNQTLGQNFNKYSVVIDRAFIKFDPFPWLSLIGGRIANPYLSTDLVYADDLNFEGVATTLKLKLTDSLEAFAVGGWFPIQENQPLKSTSRDMLGLQGGINLKLASAISFKGGVALYRFRGIEGQREDDANFSGVPLIPNYGTRFEYADGLRQRGNTLFAVNAFSDLANPTIWGLASGFRELNLTGSLDLAYFDPVHIVITGDYVKNLDFSRSKMEQRTGVKLEDGKDYGYLGRILVGQPNPAKRGDWNVSLTYRYLGSDAVLDAFTNSDFGLGGTNNKGYILAASYGLDKNTWLSARWLSSDLIDPMVPAYGGFQPKTKLSVDVFQLDINARF